MGECNKNFNKVVSKEIIVLIFGGARMRAAITKNGITYTGFDSKDNGNIIVEEKGDYIYVIHQVDEWTREHVSIIVLNRNNLHEHQKYFLHNISVKNYRDIQNGKTLYRVTEFCHESLAEKVFYSKNEAIQKVTKYLLGK